MDRQTADSKELESITPISATNLKTKSLIFSRTIVEKIKGVKDPTIVCLSDTQCMNVLYIL